MEDTFVKPGNQERGWNDPPQFSYGLQASHSNKKNLSKRVPVPQYTTGPGAPPPGASRPPFSAPPTLPLSGLTPPPGASRPPFSAPPTFPLPGLTPPPRTTNLPPPPGIVTPPQRQPMIGQKVMDAGGQQEGEPEFENVGSALREALSICRQSVKKQVCDDVEKRIRLLEECWRAGRLSLAVRRRMDTLTQEMRRGRWVAADEIHRALMVDHVGEVSQWMVGVKRLIAETRNISVAGLPEPLESSGECQSNVEEEPLDKKTYPRIPEPLEGSGELQSNAEEPLEKNIDEKQEGQDAMERLPSADRT